MTRLVEISTLWLIFKVFGNFFEGLFSIWSKYEPTFENAYAIEQIFIFENGQILNK